MHQGVSGVNRIEPEIRGHTSAKPVRRRLMSLLSHSNPISPPTTKAPYRTKFRRTKFFGEQNFQHRERFSALLSTGISSTKRISQG